MITFKQLEAVFWVVQAGGFSQAAMKLHTTQSAISKRVQELEQMFGLQLFDRGRRAVGLTEKGEEVFILAKRLLEQRDVTVAQLSRAEVLERRLAIGITELTAMTWLPQLVKQIQSHYPRVIIEPHVDMSINLRDKLLADEIDMMIVPNAYEDARFASMPLGKVENVWWSKPGLCDSSKPMKLHQLAAQRILVDRSGPGILYSQWFKSHGFQPENVIVSNSIVALIGMTVSGLGVSYFPKACLSQMNTLGMLEVLRVTPSLPDVTYVAMYKSGLRSSLIASIIMLAQECCDFTKILQTS
ncbi:MULTISPECIES: LysR family transcriptional regulator [unclassified Cupriavidus]|uniref:LysR family transcriptional regulator n=1 Tax=unclassified Cupriavidus TaxID=2640874 RepID=UPI001C00022C|nr:MULTISPECIES: LysR family transcriptional regulator [unclassified Cupriavidus]MCA3184681.1 LysR family transcriptional regulator [Cupriavidus sp.]MCA3189138.1 LysR family transcriptional regulator [Cupriavidus sp.]MCA3198858.1 LysR family transcriptional regulator [Cupriavidus sp.]MCA3201602.1 LysR family transcriptional regulator [Cupriavidus sp.]QWE97165.1 LysR family transcriptional regulator [Cupriavidus sp. EM10]